ncbi:MAG: hypothetical protein LBD07_05860 [Spirochaetaceae bacterium]|jgi:hypothetical protein|nr:hypothetical protein [Spirochaetaceae bacterium]
MTLSRHTLLLKLGIVIAATVLAGIAFISGMILPLYPGIAAAAVQRTYPAFIIAYFPETTPYAAYFSVLASVFYGLVTLILLFYFFEKTQSAEVHFFMFFVLSLVFESMRTALPLKQALNLPVVYMRLMAHILVFCRYFGVFSLFCASLYSAGLQVKKEENIIVPLIIITLFLSFKMPVNQYTWNTALCLIDGYPIAFRMIEFVIASFAILSFLSGAFKRSIKEYYFIGIGSFFAFLGRAVLLDSDVFVLIPFALLLLFLGTYMICAYLRRIYLWA